MESVVYKVMESIISKSTVLQLLKIIDDQTVRTLNLSS